MEWRDAVKEAERQLVAEKELHPDAIKSDYWRNRFNKIQDAVCARASRLQGEAVEEERALYKKLNEKYEGR